MKRTLWIAGVMCGTLAAFSQTTAAPAFDVASIRPSSEQAGSYMRFLPGGRLSGMSWIKQVIQIAYGVHDYQVTGGPEWLNTDRYYIEAKTEKTDATKEEMTAMLQTLLTDRFKLRVRQETRDLTVYDLVVDKGGSKLKPLAKGEPQPCVRGRDFVCGMTSPEQLALSLRYFAGRPVIDKTGLEGRYDVQLDFDMYSARGQTPPADYDKPSLEQALEDQLGLRMVPAKMAMPMYVVESISRPSEN